MIFASLVALMLSTDGGGVRQLPCEALEAAVATRGKYDGSVRDYAIVEAELRQVWPSGRVPLFARPAGSIGACSGARYQVSVRKPRSTFLAVEARLDLDTILVALRVSKAGATLFNGAFCLRVTEKDGRYTGSHAEPRDCEGMLLWR